MDLSELRPGSYRSRSPNPSMDEYAMMLLSQRPDFPQEFKYNKFGDYEMVKKMMPGMLEGRSFGGPPQKFTGHTTTPDYVWPSVPGTRSTAGKVADPTSRFVPYGKKGAPDAEDIDPLTQRDLYFSPKKDVLPPGDRYDLPMTEQAQDITASLVRGTLGGLGEIASTPRSVMDKVNTLSRNRDIIPGRIVQQFPTQDEAVDQMKQFITKHGGLSERGIENLNSKARTGFGEGVQSVAEYGPYTVGGAVPLLRKLIPGLFRLQSML